MKSTLILTVLAMLLGACEANPPRNPIDNALCEAAATDVVERSAQRQLCR